MDEWIVITLNHDVWYSGTHNSCCMWIKKLIKLDSQDEFYIVPLSLCNKLGIDKICELLNIMSNFA